MNEDEIKKLRVLCDAATLATKSASFSDTRKEVERIRAIATYEAAARTAIPELLKELEQLKLQNESLRSYAQNESDLNHKAQIKLVQAMEVLKFYSGHSQSEAKRLISLDAGEQARKLLKSWESKPSSPIEYDCANNKHQVVHGAMATEDFCKLCGKDMEDPSNTKD